MNRTIFGGVAIFFAVLAIAMVGNQNTASAGWGCHGGCGGLFSHHRCHGGGLFSGRCHGGGLFGGRCNGGCHSSCNGLADCSGSDCGGSSCHGDTSCHGGRRCHGGLFARLRAHHRCHGWNRCNGWNGCNGASTCSGTIVEPSCHGGTVIESAPIDDSYESAPEVPPAPPSA